jgi:hypothetical protein
MKAMTFTSHLTSLSARSLSRGAVTAVALLSTVGLVACGSDNDDSKAADDAAAAAAAASSAAADASAFSSMELTAAQKDLQTKAEDYGYTCSGHPDLGGDSSVTVLSCRGNGGDFEKFPGLTIFDKADAASGAEVAGKQVDKMWELMQQNGMGASSDEVEYGSESREEMAAQVLPLDGEGVVGYCDEISKGCDAAAKAVGLDISVLPGTVSKEDQVARRDADMNREVDRMEADRKREAETYRGWDSLDQAKGQLRAWDITGGCRDDRNGQGKVAFCDLNSLILGVGMGVDEMEKRGAFEEVARDEFTKVSDGDWVFLCTPGAEDKCEAVADRTGKSVEQDA